MWGGLRFKCCFKSFIFVCVEGLSLGAKLHSVPSKCIQCRGEVGVAEEARVERDVEEQRDRTSERDTERGICKVEDKEEKEKRAVRERGRTCYEKGDSAQEEKERRSEERKKDILTVAV